MNEPIPWDAIGALAEVLGGIAVIGSLIYLAIQIRSNSQLAIASTERELTRDWEDINSVVSSNNQVAEIWSKGHVDYNALTIAERQQYASLCEQFVTYHLNAWKMHESGFFNKDWMEATDRMIVSILKADGASKWWAEFGPMHPQEHFHYISDLLEANDTALGANEYEFYRRVDT